MLESPSVFTREAEIASTYGPIEKISMFLASWCRQKAVQQKWLSLLSSFSRDSTWRCYLLTSNEPGSLPVVKYHIALKCRETCVTWLNEKNLWNLNAMQRVMMCLQLCIKKPLPTFAFLSNYPSGRWLFQTSTSDPHCVFFSWGTFRDCLPLCLSNDPWQIAEHATDNGRLAEKDKGRKLVGFRSSNCLAFMCCVKHPPEDRELTFTLLRNCSAVHIWRRSEGGIASFLG